MCPAGRVLPIRGCSAWNERRIFFRLQVYERVEILVVEVYEKVAKSANSVCERT